MHRTLRRCCVSRAVTFCRLQHSKAAKESSEEWIGVVGLEIHAQISTKSKLFSRASTQFSSPVNTNVSLFDAAIPGTLPVINKSCAESAVKTALALECEINPASTFDRKHYFYADMPAGYQITQQRNALAHNGVLRFYVNPPSGKPYLKSSSIKQLQLEQDSGKSLHDTYEKKSLVDLNRAGVGLMELVFEPDLSDGEEAASLVKELTLIFGRLGTCDCKMQEGSMRVDANVSVQRAGATELGPRTEIKNISSIRGVANAVNFEIKRQIEANKKNQKIVMETRSYDNINKITVSMRDKEEKQDYRFMPEPNLPPLRLSLKEDVDKNIISVPLIKKNLPELPEKSRQKLLEEFDLATIHAINLVNEDHLLELFYAVVRQVESPKPRIIYDVICTGLQTLFNQKEISFEDSPITVPHLVELYNLRVAKKVTSNTVVKLMLELADDASQSVEKIIADKGWMLITDLEIINKICLEVVQENAKLVRSFQRGKEKAFSQLVKAAGKKCNNQVDSINISECLKKIIEQQTPPN